MSVSATNVPLVSVICLCYNHEKFVEEALWSVVTQSYPRLEMIIVDDASTDESVKVVQRFLLQQKGTQVKTLFLPENRGNCKAFNQGLAMATGKYVIDFATDDIMLPHRIEEQLAFFEQLPSSCGVVFTEAAYIGEDGEFLFYHYQDKLRLKTRHIPAGNVYAALLQRYFVCGPTMMVRKEVFDRLGGYDERLAYEDFDFWIRSSRYYQYAFMPVCTTKVRKSLASMSAQIGKKGDKQLYATYLVCKKAVQLNTCRQEHAALAKRIRHELRQCISTANFREAKLFLYLLCRTQGRCNIYYFAYRLLGFANKKVILQCLYTFKSWRLLPRIKLD